MKSWIKKVSILPNKVDRPKSGSRVGREKPQGRKEGESARAQQDQGPLLPLRVNIDIAFPDLVIDPVNRPVFEAEASQLVLSLQSVRAQILEPPIQQLGKSF